MIRRVYLPLTRAGYLWNGVLNTNVIDPYAIKIKSNLSDHISLLFVSCDELYKPPFSPSSDPKSLTCLIYVEPAWEDLLDREKGRK